MSASLNVDVVWNYGYLRYDVVGGPSLLFSVIRLPSVCSPRELLAFDSLVVNATQFSKFTESSAIYHAVRYVTHRMSLYSNSNLFVPLFVPLGGRLLMLMHKCGKRPTLTAKVNRRKFLEVWDLEWRGVETAGILSLEEHIMMP